MWEVDDCKPIWDQGEAGTIEADLLRPLDFFGGQWPVVGDELELDMQELGLAGAVEVTAISPCPSINFGPGRIVLSVFRHSRGSTGALYLVGHTEPIRVTALHPIWSPSHDDWIPAGQLTALHSVSLWKSECRVDRYELDVREEPVYNVEVDGDHCYRVSECSLLVHNDSGKITKQECGKYVNRLRDKYSTEEYDKDDNAAFACAEVIIGGEVVKRVSALSGEERVYGPNMAQIPAKPMFTPHEVGHMRDVDAEYKIFEDKGAYLVDNPCATQVVVRLCISKKRCGSCISVTSQFKARFPEPQYKLHITEL